MFAKGDHIQEVRITRSVRWINPFRNVLKSAPPVQSERRVPDGIRVYCVGDIHGRDDLLEEMAARVKGDMESGSFDEVVTVFLGDYVDRGLGSMPVVEKLSRGEWPTSIVALAGNHEDLLLAFLEDASVLEAWRSLGGLETLHSYGVNVRSAMTGRDFGTIRQAFVARLPEGHRHFLANLKVSTTIGDYFFCHAGVRPGVPLDRQDREHLLTIRSPFLSSEAEHGKVVVHGHTPAVTPEVRPNRIGIDTAAYATNRLTCLVLEQCQQRFLQAGSEQGSA
jgi:serine/threonine protein phosphatase 1